MSTTDPSNHPSRARRARRLLPLVTLTALVAAVALPLAGGCASTSAASEAEGDALRITLRDYRVGQRFEIVSRSHTDPVAQYSRRVDDPARKVEEDVVVAKTIEHLASQGFEEFAQVGPAPRAGGFTKAFEIEGPGGTMHFVVGPGSTAEQQRAMATMARDFIQLYSAIPAFQTVDNPDGARLFEAGDRR